MAPKQTEPLIYFSYGMTKSGSTLAFELVRTALEYCGYEQCLLPTGLIDFGRNINYVDRLDSDQAEKVWEYVSRLGYPLVLKTHARPSPSVQKLLTSGRAMGHASYRDPRDLALSLMDAGRKAKIMSTAAILDPRGLAHLPIDGRSRAKTPRKIAFSEITSLNAALMAIDHQQRTLAQWLKLPGIIPLDFEDVVHDKTETTEGIMARLNLEAPAPKIINRVLEERFTQFNKGIQHRHQSELSDQDSTRIRREFPAFFQILIDGKHELPTDGRPVLLANNTPNIPMRK